MPANDCCCGCGAPCRFRSRAKTHGARIFATAESEEVEQEEEGVKAMCNSQKLRNIMEEVGLE